MSYFNNNVCKRLHCENGVLQGHLVEEDDDDDDDVNLFFNVMRWIVAILVLIAIFLYGKLRTTMFVPYLTNFELGHADPLCSCRQLAPQER